MENSQEFESNIIKLIGTTKSDSNIVIECKN